MNPPPFSYLQPVVAIRFCRNHLLKFVMILAAASLGFSQFSSAANGSWNNAGATADWNINANWSPATSNPGASGTATGNTDVATFGNVGTVAHTVTDSVTNRMLGSFVISGSGTGSNYTIGSSANTLYLNAASISTFSGSNSSTIASNIMMTGATASLNASSTGTLTLSGTLSSSAASGTSRFQFSQGNAADVVLLSGNIIDGANAAVAITHGAGVGTLNLTGVNTYTGGFVNGGGSSTNTTQIGVDSVGSVGSITSSAFGTGTLAFNQGQISSDGTTARTIYNVLDFKNGTNIFGDTVNNGTLTFAGAITNTLGFTGNVTLQANSAVDFTNTGATTGNGINLTLSGAANGSIAAVLSTTINTFIKAGTGTWTLSGAGTSTAAPTINDGTLKLGINNAIKSGNNLTVNELTAGNTATLDLGGFNQQLNILTLGGTGATSTSTNQVINSTGTSTLTVSGVTSTATNDPLGGLISVTTLNLNGSARTFTIGNSANAVADLTVSSSIQNGGVTKAGTGTLVFSGSNTYASATLVNAGTLLVSGTHTGAGAYTIASGATLGGDGTITTASNASVTVSSGGLLAPTASLNKLTMDLGTGSLDIIGAVTASNSQSMIFNLGAIGTSSQIRLSNASSSLKIGAGLLNFDDFVFTLDGGFTGGTFTLFDTLNNINGSLGTSLTGTIGGLNAYLSLSLDGQDILVTVVPEPNTTLLLLGGIGMLLGLRHFRRRAESISPNNKSVA